MRRQPSMNDLTTDSEEGVVGVPPRALPGDARTDSPSYPPSAAGSPRLSPRGTRLGPDDKLDLDGFREATALGNSAGETPQIVKHINKLSQNMHKPRSWWPTADMRANMCLIFVVSVLSANITSVVSPNYFDGLMTRFNLDSLDDAIVDGQTFFDALVKNILPALVTTDVNGTGPVINDGGHPISAFDRQIGLLRIVQTRSSPRICHGFPDIDAIDCDANQGYYIITPEDSTSFGANSQFVFTGSGTPRYCGIFACYSGSGFTETIDTRVLNSSVAAANALSAANFFDKHTRALSIEFVLFHPSMNLFACVRILAEFPLTAAAVISVDLNVMRWYHYVTDWDWCILVVEIFFLFILGYHFKWMRDQYWKYGTKMVWRGRVWTVGMLIVSSLVLVCLRIAEGIVLAGVVPAKADAFPQVWPLQRLTQSQEVTWGILVFVVWIRQLDYARFVKTTALYSRVLLSMLFAFLPFGLLMFIIFGAFSHMANMLFFRQSNDFGSFFNTMFNLFRTLSTSDNMLTPIMPLYPVLAKFFFVIFMGFVWLFVLNLLITVLGSAYADTIDEKYKDDAMNEVHEENILGEGLSNFADRVVPAEKTPEEIAAEEAAAKKRKRSEERRVRHLDRDVAKLDEMERRMEQAIYEGQQHSSMLKDVVSQLVLLQPQLTQAVTEGVKSGERLDLIQKQTQSSPRSKQVEKEMAAVRSALEAIRKTVSEASIVRQLDDEARFASAVSTKEFESVMQPRMERIERLLGQNIKTADETVTTLKTRLEVVLGEHEALQAEARNQLRTIADLEKDKHEADILLLAAEQRLETALRQAQAKDTQLDLLAARNHRLEEQLEKARATVHGEAETAVSADLMGALNELQEQINVIENQITMEGSHGDGALDFEHSRLSLSIRTLHHSLSTRIDSMVAQEMAREDAVRDLKSQLAEVVAYAAQHPDDPLVAYASPTLENLANLHAALAERLDALIEKEHTREHSMQQLHHHLANISRVRHHGDPDTESDSPRRVGTPQPESHAALDRMNAFLVKEHERMQKEREKEQADMEAMRIRLQEAELRARTAEGEARVVAAARAAHEAELAAAHQTDVNRRMEAYLADLQDRDTVIHALRTDRSMGTDISFES